LKTKDRIIATALRLFNEQGTKAVSTNHIAAAAKMSPGNLYYYFKNKGEIIRDIFSIMINEFNKAECLSGEACLEQMGKHMEQVLEVQWKYRSLQMELMSLVEQDDWLKQQMKEVHQLHLEQFKNFIIQMIEVGMMKALPEETINILSENCWIIAIFWQPYLHLGGSKITKEKLQEGIQRVHFLLYPYLTDPESMAFPSFEIPHKTV